MAKWDDLKKALVEAVEARAKSFLDAHADVRAFLVERAERLAKLSYDYAKARTKKKRDVLRRDMEVVKQTMENELSSLALSASGEARSIFADILGAAADTLVKALPALLAAL